MRRPLSLRLRASLTVEALYVFSLLFLSLTAATRFVYREQARCTAGFLLEDLAVQASRADSRTGDIAAAPAELKSHYLRRLSSLLPVGDSNFTVWCGQDVGGVELRAPRFSARIEYKPLRPETALRSTNPLPDSTKEITP